MSKYDTPEIVCTALSVFITEIRNQAAAIRAYDNIFQTNVCDNVFLQQSYDSIGKELLSEIARIFDKANTGSSENCTLYRLRNLCLQEPYSVLFPDGEKNCLIQSLDMVFEEYCQLPISYSRKKQLAHHDLKQVVAGDCIEISMEQVENLIAKTTDVFSKIYMRFYFDFFEITFPDYKMLVECFTRDINKLVL